MSSIAQALLWEMSVRGRWPIPAFFVLGNAMPLLVYSALSHYAVDRQDPSWVLMHVMFLPLMMFQYAIGIVQAQGSLSRLYAVPISTRSLVAWHMVPGAVVLAAEVGLSLWGLNQLFHVGHPVWGPTVFAAAAWCSAQLLVCVAHRSFSSFCMTIAPCVVLFCWLHARYGFWFSMARHYWTNVTTGELLTLGIAGAASFAATVAVVARDRCGEQLPRLIRRDQVQQIVDLWNRRTMARLPSLSSAMQAQLWYEWRMKGVLLPLIVLTILGFAAGIVLLRLLVEGEFEWRDLHEGLIAGGALLSLVAALTGLAVGLSTGAAFRNHNPTLRDLTWVEGSDQMGHFLATRPLTNQAFSRAILQTAAQSVVIAWGIWSVAFWASALNAMWLQHSPDWILPPRAGLWYLMLTLLGPWAALTNVATAILSGRGARFIYVWIGLLFVGVLMTLVAEACLTAQTREWLGRMVVAAVSGAILVGTVAAFVLAKRRHLAEHRVVLCSAIGWLLMAVVAYLLRPAELPLDVLPVIAAAAALVVLPFATAPLAIAWNRHR